MSLRGKALDHAAAVAPIIVALLLTAPVIAGLAGTLFPAFGYFPALGGTRFTLDAFRELFVEQGLAMSLAMSLFTGLCATALSLLIVISILGAAGGTGTFRWLMKFTSPLLAVPHAAAAFGFLFLFSPSGFLVRLVSPELTGWTRPPDVLIPNDPMGFSLIAGLVVKEVPFLMLMALPAMGQVRMMESRRMMAAFGYGRMAGFVLGLWPQIYRRMRLPVFAVLTFSVGVVDVAAILGPTNPAPLAVRLVEWMNDPDLAMRFKASAGAVLLTLETALALGLWLGLERMGSMLVHYQSGNGRRFARDQWARGASVAIAALTSLTVLAGLALLALWSVAGLWQFPDAIPAGLTLASWQNALPQVAGPLWTSVQAAGLSAGISIILAVLTLHSAGHRSGQAGIDSGLRQWLIYAPLIVPQAAFLFGLQLLVLGSSIEISIALLAMAHLVFVLPYVFLSLRDPWRGFDQRYEQVAFGLGQSRWTVFWRVRLPMLLRPILTAFAVGFAVSAGLYLPTVLIGAGRLPTITSEAVALASGGSRRVIGVYAFLQTALPFVVFLLTGLIPALLFANRRAMRH